jgi:hypothetical protein
MAREGVPLIVIQRQLGHTNLGITSIYLQGIDNAEVIDTVHARLDLTRSGGHVWVGLRSLLLDHLRCGCEPRSGETRASG